ncbi:unnamed protein product, partial [Didymodactylos carnosus]
DEDGVIVDKSESGFNKLDEDVVVDKNESGFNVLDEDGVVVDKSESGFNVLDEVRVRFLLINEVRPIDDVVVSIVDDRALGFSNGFDNESNGFKLLMVFVVRNDGVLEEVNNDEGLLRVGENNDDGEQQQIEQQGGCELDEDEY